MHAVQGLRGSHSSCQHRVLGYKWTYVGMTESWRSGLQHDAYSSRAPWIQEEGKIFPLLFALAKRNAPFVPGAGEWVSSESNVHHCDINYLPNSDLENKFGQSKHLEQLSVMRSSSRHV